MLESTAHYVDWIVVANYSSIDDRIVDAAVIRCKDGLFKRVVKDRACIRLLLLI